MELVDENDEATRISLLSLIPRRQDRRASQPATPPSIAGLAAAVSGETDQLCCTGD